MHIRTKVLWHTSQRLLPATIALILCNSAAQAGTIQMGVEEPVASGTHSGVSNLRGWAVSTSGIDKVELYINGSYKTDIPYGGSRKDVEDDYPSYPDARQSGYSMAYNYNLLEPGQHSFKIKVYDQDGATQEMTRSFTSTRFGDHTFINNIDDIDLSGATVTGSGSQLSINGMKVKGVGYNVAANWNTGAQGMRYQTLAPSSGTGGNTGGDGCVDVPLVSSGTRAQWSLSGSQAGATVTSDIDTTFSSVTTTGATTNTTNTSSSQGMSTTTTDQEIKTYQINDHYIYVSKIQTKGSATVYGYTTAYDTSTTFSPAWQAAPALHLCAGQTWTSAPVTQTITSSGIQITEQTESTSGRVEAVNESVTVPAGTFNTVRFTTENSDGTTSVWNDIATGVMVKQTFSGSDGAQTVTTLNSLN